MHLDRDGVQFRFAEDISDLANNDQFNKLMNKLNYKKYIENKDDLYCHSSYSAYFVNYRQRTELWQDLELNLLQLNYHQNYQ